MEVNDMHTEYHIMFTFSEILTNLDKVEEKMNNEGLALTGRAAVNKLRELFEEEANKRDYVVNAHMYDLHMNPIDLDV